MDKIARYTGFAAVTASLLLAASFLIVKVYDLDFGFHMKIGEYIVTNLRVPFHDMLSYTAEGNRYIDSHWLFQAVLYTVYRIAGGIGPMLFQAAVIAALFAVVFRAGYAHGGALACSSGILLVAMTVSERFLVRPEILSFLFTGLYFRILYLYRYEKRDYLYLLPLLHVIWANVHGLFILGIVLVAAVLAGEAAAAAAEKLGGVPLVRTLDGPRLKKLSLYLPVLVFCCFINPYTYRGAAYPFLLFSEIGRRAPVFMQEINELKPAFSGFMLNDTYYFFRLLILLSVAGFAVNYRKTDPVHLIVFTGFLYLSVAARRNIAVFSIPAVFILMHNMQESAEEDGLFGRIPRNLRRVALLPALLLVTAASLVYSAGVVSDRYYMKNLGYPLFGTGISEVIYPERAVDFIKGNGVSGNIFLETYGSYFAWRCYPERKVFVDGRWEVYGHDFLEGYQNTIKAEKWDVLFGSYGVTHVLMGHADASFLFPRMYGHKEWALVFVDEIATLFLKRGCGNDDIISRYEIRLEDDVPVFTGREDNAGGSYRKKLYDAYTHYLRSTFYLMVERYDDVIDELGVCLKIYPGMPVFEIYKGLGMACFFKGRTRDAVINYRKALDIREDASVRHKLGFAYNSEGRYREAIVNYRKAIRLYPDNCLYYNNMGISYYNLEDYGRAEEYFLKSLEVNPFYPHAFENLERVYGITGNPEKIEKVREYVRSRMSAAQQ